MSLMIEVRIICDKIAKTKTRLLKDTKIGDILKINKFFDSSSFGGSFGRHTKFTVTNERTGENEEFTNNQFTNAIHEFSFRQI